MGYCDLLENQLIIERAFNLAGDYDIRFSIVNTNAYSEHKLSVYGSNIF